MQGWRRFLNGYGPTEVTVAASYFRVTGLSCRRPSSGAATGQQSPLRTGSRLYCPTACRASFTSAGRAGVATPTSRDRERFIPDPFSGRPGSRLYRRATGATAGRQYVSFSAASTIGSVRGFRVEPRLKQRSNSTPSARRRQSPHGLSPRHRLLAFVVPSAGTIELWPSVAEYFIYDDLLYSAMTNDHRRNQCYRAALERLVVGKTVLDIGTGKDAILARLCVETGARKVYAVEILEETFEKARACIKGLGLEDRIQLIRGDVTRIDLPEPVDVCVSEIVGAIGGAEGAAVILNDARRLMKPGGVMIPARSTTRMRGSASQMTSCAAAFSRYGRVRRAHLRPHGHNSDLRVCLKGITPAPTSAVGVFEALTSSLLSQREG